MNNKIPLHQSKKLEKPELSLVIPCYNEQDAIQNTALRLIESFHNKDIDIELVLVDNGSTDDTGNIIDDLIAKGFEVVKERIQVNQGYGHGILRG
jgi:glycosyltransferase involved in cell wall biosynthesis